MHILFLNIIATFLSCTIPVLSESADDTPPIDLRVLQWNIWEGGVHVNDYQNKQVSIILNSGADIAGLEETTSDHATTIGQQLGWYSWQSSKSVGIVSKYPIVEEYGEITRAGGVRVNVSKPNPKDNSSTISKEVNLWSIHTEAYPYGPYEFCYNHLSDQEVTGNETSCERLPQVEQTLEGIQGQIDAAGNGSGPPIVFTGDFNAPSHLDWTANASSLHCGYEYAWPTSVAAINHGLLDSFRTVNPDPFKVPGTTWSPIYPYDSGTTGPVEPQDRIDFIYYKGLTPVDSHVVLVGHPQPYPNVSNNEWPSDHAAVLTHFLF